jgi:hypothetical protein
MWQGSRATTVEGNTFINCQARDCVGLVIRPGGDHRGGVIRNNFVYRDTWVAGDAAVNVIDSAGTRVLHNTILQSGTYPNAIEYRFPGATGVSIINNLTDAPSGRVTAEPRCSKETRRPPADRCSRALMQVSCTSHPRPRRR